MASSNRSPNDGVAPQEPADNPEGMQADSSAHYEETKEVTETMKNSEELLTKLESGFIALMKALVMGKFGEPLSGLMTNFLECSICKELMIEAVFRFSCEHTFCRHCLIHWTRNSLDCPICRDDWSLVLRNPLIDGVVNILVDFTFSEDEKMERINSVQERATSSVTVDNELLAFIQQNMVRDPNSIHADLSLICKYLCMRKSWVFLREIFTNEEVCQVIYQTKEDERIVGDEIHEMFDSFVSDFRSLCTMFNSLPTSWFSR